MTEPPITLRAIHDSGPGNFPITRVVIHSTCPDVGFPRASMAGMARGTALYFQQQASGGSAHYIVDVAGEEHCVPDSVIAWHAPPNKGSIGIEINSEGGNYPNNYTREQWLSPQVWPAVVRAAARTRELCDRFGIPRVKLSAGDLVAGRHGICGHVDVSLAFRQTDHTDPGPNFPWAEFLQEVQGTQAGGPDPAPAPIPSPTEDCVMYIFIGDDMSKDPVGIAILSGSLLIGLGPAGSAEYVSAMNNVRAKLAPAQWVSNGTFAALDTSSHNVHDHRADGTLGDPVVVKAAPAS